MAASNKYAIQKEDATRMAQLAGIDFVEPNPLRALMLFQQAEIGLRIDIADGQTYYAKRLNEAIEGQQKARALVNAGKGILIAE